MKNVVNVVYARNIAVSLIAFGILINAFVNSNDLLTRVVTLPFLTFSVAFFFKNVFHLLNKNDIASWFGKACVIAFFVYWFGFLVFWDYTCITNGDYISTLFSLPMWLGGGYVIYKRFKGNKREE